MLGELGELQAVTARDVTLSLTGPEMIALEPLTRQVEKAKRKSYFWEKVRGLLLHYQIPDWETLYRCIAYGMQPTVPIPNDSS